MFWRNETCRYGFADKEKVNAYECQFTVPLDGGKGRYNRGCLVVCDKVEDAIAAVRHHYPEMIMTQVVKRNSRTDLIVVDDILALAEKS